MNKYLAFILRIIARLLVCSDNQRNNIVEYYNIINEQTKLCSPDEDTAEHMLIGCHLESLRDEQDRWLGI